MLDVNNFVSIFTPFCYHTQIKCLPLFTKRRQNSLKNNTHHLCEEEWNNRSWQQQLMESNPIAKQPQMAGKKENRVCIVIDRFVIFSTFLNGLTIAQSSKYQSDMFQQQTARITSNISSSVMEIEQSESYFHGSIG